MRLEEGVGSPGAGATDCCVPPPGRQESKLGPLEEQLLFITAEPSLQDQNLLCSPGWSQTLSGPLASTFRVMRL